LQCWPLSLATLAESVAVSDVTDNAQSAGDVITSSLLRGHAAAHEQNDTQE